MSYPSISRGDTLRGTLSRAFWNSAEQRPRALCRIVLTQLGFWGGLYGVLLPALRPTLRSLRAAGPVHTIAADLLIYGSITGLAFATLWSAARWIDKRPFADYGFHMNRDWWANGLFGALCAAGLVTVIAWLGLGMGWMELQATFDTASPAIPFWGGLVAMAVLQCCIGTWEELIFRAGILKNVAEGLGGSGLHQALVAFLVTAGPGMVFGLAHLGNVNATPVAALGIALAGAAGGLIYALTGQLSFSIGMHIAHNFFEMNVFGLTSTSAPAPVSLLRVVNTGETFWSGGSAGKDGGMILVVSVLALLGVVFGWLRLRYGQLSLRSPLVEYRPKM
jgi:uncharacterized protein